MASRFAVQSAETFARAIGYPAAPIDDLLAFHVVFGKSVPDVSLNAVANLGYADGRFLEARLPRRHAERDLRGHRPQGEFQQQSGVVFVRTRGLNQQGEIVLEYARWVMVRKRDVLSPAPAASRATAGRGYAGGAGRGLPADQRRGLRFCLAGSPYRWGDYEKGEKIDHFDGMTVEEAEHMIATAIYQNTAKVHFNQLSEGQGRFGRRLIYGGHVICLARALSFNGLANAFHIAAINAGRHVAPLFAGDTVFAWSEVLDARALPGRDDVGALRLRTCDQEPPLCRFPLARGRRLRAARRARSRLLGDSAALRESPCACPRRRADGHRRPTGDRRPHVGTAQQPPRRAAIAALSRLGARGLPIVHIRHDFDRAELALIVRTRPAMRSNPRRSPLAGETGSPRPPIAPSSARRSRRRSTRSARRRWLSAASSTHNSVEATVRHGADLGYRVFVVADACWAVDVRDLNGRLWPAEAVHALSLACLNGEYADVVSCAATLQAAGLARARERAVGKKRG